MGNLLASQQDKYKRILQKDPASKVFAPLADIYRRYAMFNEAFEILHKGIRHNPSYVPGHLALARCHYDQGQFEDCYSVLRPLVKMNKDNLKLQGLFFQVCQDLELWEEALETGKHLCYLNPHNKEWVGRVGALEGEHDSLFQNEVAGRGRKRGLFSEENLSIFPQNADEWREHNFFKIGKGESNQGNETEHGNLMDFYDKKFTPRKVTNRDDRESVKKGLQSFRNAIKQRATSILARE